MLKQQATPCLDLYNLNYLYKCGGNPMCVEFLQLFRLYSNTQKILILFNVLELVLKSGVCACARSKERVLCCSDWLFEYFYNRKTSERICLVILCNKKKSFSIYHTSSRTTCTLYLWAFEVNTCIQFVRLLRFP